MAGTCRCGRPLSAADGDWEPTCTGCTSLPDWCDCDLPEPRPPPAAKNWHTEAKRLARRSKLPPAERAVLNEMIDCADYRTGEILPEWAWKLALARLAASTGHHPSTVKRALAHLELDGYLGRRRTHGGRGRWTRYVLFPNGPPLPCECRKPRSNPAGPDSGAVRTARWRAQQRERAATRTRALGSDHEG
jgi:hypothetical protein